MDFRADFVADKAKFHRRAVARQEILTKSAAKYAEKTRTISNEYMLLYIIGVSEVIAVIALGILRPFKPML